MKKAVLLFFVVAVVAVVAVIGVIRHGGNPAGGGFSPSLSDSGKSIRQEGTGKAEDFAPVPTDRPDVRQIVMPGTASTAERLRLVHALPDDLSETDREALATFLKHGRNDEIELVIKNDLMNKLRNQRTLPPELTGVLLGLYADRGQNITVRIYALQHLRPQYELTREAEIREAFYEALNETDNEIAGGALLALRYLSMEYPEEFNTALISRRAAEIALDPGVHSLTRLTAVQVAAMFNHTEIEPEIRKLAEDSAASLTLRLAAIGGLGLLKCPESVPVLERLARTQGPEGKAARTALRKINRFKR